MDPLYHKKHVDVLSKIGKMISSSLSLDEILNSIVTITAETMGFRICSLLIFDGKKELAVKATQAISEEYKKKSPIRLGTGIAGRVAKTNEAITVPDVRKDPRYLNRDFAEKEGLCSLLSVPLSVKGKVTGVLNFYTDSPYEFGAEEIDLFTAIASQAAVVIENSQLALRSQTIQEELETRKVIERAKGILMKQGLSEDESFRRMQRKSMDRRRPMKEIAEAIILTEELEK